MRSKRIKGSFVGFNSGTISNCYSAFRSKADFCGENKGELSSYYSSSDKGINSVFDDNIWQKSMNRRRFMKFIPEKWQVDILTNEEIIFISNKKELMAFAEGVNEGKYKKTHVKLTNSINMRGALWVPIGNSKERAFKGVFDGDGHRIYNLSIKGEGLSSFFGFNSGKIINLTVDSKNYGGETASGLVGVNNGEIHCCGANVKLMGQKTVLAGGFASANTGIISRCFSSGRGFVLPLWAKFIPLLFCFFIGFSTLGIAPYKEIQYDEKQQQREEASETADNFASFEFNMVAEILGDRCKIEYVNSGESHKDVVLELQMTDGDCYKAAGFVDKSPSALQALIEKGDYDANSSWTTLARSGAIRAGNELNEMKVIPLYSGKRLPKGEYGGRIHISYYDMDTHIKEVVENSFAVVIKVN